jgi:hypothetical protein
MQIVSAVIEILFPFTEVTCAFFYHLQRLHHGFRAVFDQSICLGPWSKTAIILVGAISKYFTCRF